MVTSFAGCFAFIAIESFTGTLFWAVSAKGRQNKKSIRSTASVLTKVLISKINLLLFLFGSHAKKIVT